MQAAASDCAGQSPLAQWIQCSLEVAGCCLAEPVGLGSRIALVNCRYSTSLPKELGGHGAITYRLAHMVLSWTIEINHWNMNTISSASGNSYLESRGLACHVTWSSIGTTSREWQHALDCSMTWLSKAAFGNRQWKLGHLLKNLEGKQPTSFVTRHQTTCRTTPNAYS